MKKGISPVVGTVILIAIAVIAATSIYFWLGHYTNKPYKPEITTLTASLASPKNRKILVANTGTEALNVSTLETSQDNITCEFGEPELLEPNDQAICTLKSSTKTKIEGTTSLYSSGATPATIHIETVTVSPDTEEDESYSDAEDNENGSNNENEDNSSEGSSEQNQSNQIIQLTNCTELQNIQNDLNKNYALSSDVNCSETRYWNNGKGFKPIGSKNNPFNGLLNGNSHKVIGLFVNRSSENQVGLFGAIGNNSSVKNLGLNETVVNGRNHVGGITGWNNKGNLSNCFVKGNVSGHNQVGGLAGASVKGVTHDSYVHGSVSGHLHIGGLIGINHVGMIKDSYSSALVDGQMFAGGLTGLSNAGECVNLFWDVEASSVNFDGCDSDSFGKSTEEMRDVKTFTNSSYTLGLTEAWDFEGDLEEDDGTEDVWRMNGGLPRLSWE